MNLQVLEDEVDMGIARGIGPLEDSAGCYPRRLFQRHSMRRPIVMDERSRWDASVAWEQVVPRPGRRTRRSLLGRPDHGYWSGGPMSLTAPPLVTRLIEADPDYERDVRKLTVGYRGFLASAESYYARGYHADGNRPRRMGRGRFPRLRSSRVMAKRYQGQRQRTHDSGLVQGVAHELRALVRLTTQVGYQGIPGVLLRDQAAFEALGGGGTHKYIYIYI